MRHRAGLLRQWRPGQRRRAHRSDARAGDRSGERVWPLPLWPVYHKQIESPLGDIKNTGGATGTITAAAFLQNFVGDVPWVHLDIAGTALHRRQSLDSAISQQEQVHGVGVRLLYHFLEIWNN